MEAYEFSNHVLDLGDPSQLIIAIKQTREVIQESVAKLKGQGYTNFGFIGSSLGSFIIYNCLAVLPELKWGIINTGGEVADAVWSDKVMRKPYEANGYTKENLQNAWSDIQYPDLGDLKGKNLLLITSISDEIVGYEGAIKCFDYIKSAGPNVEVQVHKRLGHRKTVLRNLLRLRKLVRRVDL
ncbi:MAG: hypothetical protein JWO47_876 [Candidatus Saccharibacteria bacterium]|nr:hypothetical protein [Candidatus Saccharibacteria bacterium]